MTRQVSPDEIPPHAVAPGAVSLEDRFTQTTGQTLIAGGQAVARLLINQSERDKAAGLKTAGYVSGYRGSPLGGLDMALARAKKHLEPRDILVRPGVNEDLAATALWGSQLAGVLGRSAYDGVFGLWYGKGPGVDRSGDALRHANLAGTGRHGGVIALAGDDHANKSSTIPHSSEFALIDAGLPVLAPSTLQDLLDFSAYAYALSRFAGLWTAIKVTADIADATGLVDVDAHRLRFTAPDWRETDAERVGGPRNAHLSRKPIGEQGRDAERLLYEARLPAARAFAAMNSLDGAAAPCPVDGLGVIAGGRVWLELLRALEILGLTLETARDRGLGLYKVGQVWPLDVEAAARFAGHAGRLLVVEEKRALIETQLRDGLYGRAGAPPIFGKRGLDGRPLLPEAGELSALTVARAIAELTGLSELKARVAAREAAAHPSATGDAIASRPAHFCSGCPHNSSTKVPDGALALGGVGCHTLALGMGRNNVTTTHMGAEGALWVGLAPFSKTEHVFQNMGDGTYFHSGYLAIRAAHASGANITFKILYNDAVAMTGGQAVDGALTAPMIAWQLYAEGLRAIRVVTEDQSRWRGVALPPGVDVSHRDDLLTVEAALAKTPGASALIYDQTCASELRRRRKRGVIAEPRFHVVVNELVCEGCGDCSTASNCLSVVPVETEFGRKRQVDQASCNKDASCVNGFCPSFVTISGARPRRAPAEALPEDAAAHEPPPLTAPYDVLIAGVGGSGVVTIGAILAMAAHLEGKAASAMDMTGLAQKGGAVLSHLRLAPSATELGPVRVDAASADLLLACDTVVAAGADALKRLKPGVARAVLNRHDAITARFIHHPDLAPHGASLSAVLAERIGADALTSFDASAAAQRLLGDAIGANMMVVGAAWRLGLLPLAEDSILRAIALNGVAVELNTRAFQLGRVAAADPATLNAALAAAGAAAPAHRTPVETLDAMIARRRDELAAYQDEAYARAYAERVGAVRARETLVFGAREALTRAVARNLFKLMAIKDEYEVARLHASPAFRRQLEADFEGDLRLTFHLAPPGLSRRDPTTGQPRKRAFGAWMLPVFKLLRHGKRLRGGVFDLFGRTEERRLERRLRDRYAAAVDAMATALSHDTLEDFEALAALPERIRGFGHIRARSVEAVEADWRALEARLDLGAVKA